MSLLIEIRIFSFFAYFLCEQGECQCPIPPLLSPQYELAVQVQEENCSVRPSDIDKYSRFVFPLVN